LLARLAENPPAGAVPLNVTVPVAICPKLTVAGLNESPVTKGGATVRVPAWLFPLGSVAEMLTAVDVETGSAVAAKVAVLPAPGKLMAAGTVAALGMLLTRETLRPAGGAGPFNVMVPTQLWLPVTVTGLKVTERTVAGLTVSVLLAVLVPSAAVTVTFFAAATPTVFAVNV
jgi:hypothetical protein